MTTRIASVFAIGVLVMGAAVLAMTPEASRETGGAVTFHRDVLPILQKNCQSCHRPGQIGPMPLLSYKEARPWAKAIREAVVSRKMPPWFADPQYGHFTNDRSLKQTEIDTLAAWANSGASEGDPKDAPVPVRWPEGGWNIQPDAVVELPAYSVPAREVKEWESIALPAPFKEDTWVTSAETMPGEASVIHHLCYHFEKHRPTTVYNRYEWMEVPRDEAGVSRKAGGSLVMAEGTVLTREVGSSEVKSRKGRLSIRGSNDFCYLPGLTYEDYRPANAGFLVPAGSDIIVNLHYTTNGLAVVDRTKLGFTVTKTPPKKKFVPQGSGEGGDAPVPANDAVAAALVRHTAGISQLAIPPYESNYMAPLADIAFNRDVELVWFRPHAHVRGKSVQYKLIYPDGREEIVLNVPRYDFNWQLTYRTSLKIPKGARMHVEFRYDNSVNNKFNPDPGKWVYYGDQSWEEMGSPNMGFLMDRDADEKGFMTRR